ncbi:MAG: reverse transcriptase/maturase family protein [Oscillospiraceae bacterium]|nr:reverse transcriptase/maturase family protein [Oscillospiraceae bacterium]
MYFEKIYNFQNLYQAHRAARLGKQHTREVIEFEMDLAGNLTRLSDTIREKNYRMTDYYSFYVRDPKLREIHALHYPDRVVQHCICDEVLCPVLDPKLIYDNASCRTGKGTHFAIDRVSGFLREFYRRNGTGGYFLKCDIRKYFDNVDHDILKSRLRRVFREPEMMALLEQVIDSYETAPGKGLPLGNQTSQWFAILYLDSLDRLVKERLQIRYYSRYMDDCILIHSDRDVLRNCLNRMNELVQEKLKLEFNEKTQIFPLRNGVNYLGWHFYLTETGKVIRKVRNQSKRRYRNKLRLMQYKYAEGSMELDSIKQVLTSYHAHLSHGHTYKLQERTLQGFVLAKSRDTCQKVLCTIN